MVTSSFVVPVAALILMFLLYRILAWPSYYPRWVMRNSLPSAIHAMGLGLYMQCSSASSRRRTISRYGVVLAISFSIWHEMLVAYFTNGTPAGRKPIRPRRIRCRTAFIQKPL